MSLPFLFRARCYLVAVMLILIIDGSSVFFEQDGRSQWAMMYKKVDSVEKGRKNLTVALAPADFSSPWISPPHPVIGPGTEICSSAMTEGPTLMKNTGGVNPD